MYINKDKKIIVELGGIQVDRDILINICDDQGLATFDDAEAFLQSKADAFLRDFLERYENTYA